MNQRRMFRQVALPAICSSILGISSLGCSRRGDPEDSRQTQIPTVTPSQPAHASHVITRENTLELTDANFDEAVLHADKPVLVDFWAEWAGPCKALNPVIDELATDYRGRIKIGKVNIDSNREVSVRFSVSAVPVVMLFNKGEVVEKFVGLREKRDFQAALDRVAEPER